MGILQGPRVSNRHRDGAGVQRKPKGVPSYRYPWESPKEGAPTVPGRIHISPTKQCRVLTQDATRAELDKPPSAEEAAGAKRERG